MSSCPIRAVRSFVQAPVCAASRSLGGSPGAEGDTPHGNRRTGRLDGRHRTHTPCARRHDDAMRTPAVLSTRTPPRLAGGVQRDADRSVTADVPPEWVGREEQWHIAEAHQRRYEAEVARRAEETERTRAVERERKANPPEWSVEWHHKRANEHCEGTDLLDSSSVEKVGTGAVAERADHGATDTADRAALRLPAPGTVTVSLSRRRARSAAYATGEGIAIHESRGTSPSPGTDRATSGSSPRPSRGSSSASWSATAGRVVRGRR